MSYEQQPHQHQQEAASLTDEQVAHVESLQESIGSKLQTLITNPNLRWVGSIDTPVADPDNYVYGGEDDELWATLFNKYLTISRYNDGSDPGLQAIGLQLYNPKGGEDELLLCTARLNKSGQVYDVDVEKFIFGQYEAQVKEAFDSYRIPGYALPGPHLYDTPISHYEDFNHALDIINQDVVPSGDVSRLASWVHRSAEEDFNKVRETSDRFKGARHQFKPVKNELGAKIIDADKAFDYISNQSEIVHGLEEAMLQRHFEEIDSGNFYSYVLPRHNGKQVTVTSSNFYANDVEFNTDTSESEITIHVDNAATDRQHLIRLTGAGAEGYVSDDKPEVVGDLLRDVLDYMLEQDQSYPALTADIRRHLNEIDDNLVHHMAAGQLTPGRIAAAISGLRYYLGRSDVMPERTRDIKIRNQANHTNLAIIDKSIMSKDGLGRSIPVSRKLLIYDQDTFRMLETDSHRDTIDAFSLEDAQELEGGTLFGSILGHVISSPVTFRQLAKNEDSNLRHLSLVETAQLLADYEYTLGGIRYQSIGSHAVRRQVASRSAEPKE